MYDITGTDYKFVESNEVEFYGIKLLTGQWKDVIYIYGKVKITEQPELDLATLGFTYNIQESGEFEADDLINDPKFKDYLGAVLQHIMENSLAESEKNKEGIIGIGSRKSNTNSHTEPSNQ